MALPDMLTDAGVEVGEDVGLGVGEIQVVVKMLSSHPPAKLPESPGPSSNTYNDHVPLAPTPLKTDRVVPYGPAGAGAG